MWVKKMLIEQKYEKFKLIELPSNFNSSERGERLRNDFTIFLSSHSLYNKQGNLVIHTPKRWSNYNKYQVVIEDKEIEKEIKTNFKNINYNFFICYLKESYNNRKIKCIIPYKYEETIPLIEYKKDDIIKRNNQYYKIKYLLVKEQRYTPYGYKIASNYYCSYELITECVITKNEKIFSFKSFPKMKIWNLSDNMKNNILIKQKEFKEKEKNFNSFVNELKTKNIHKIRGKKFSFGLHTRWKK